MSMDNNYHFAHHYCCHSCYCNVAPASLLRPAPHRGSTNCSRELELEKRLRVETADGKRTWHRVEGRNSGMRTSGFGEQAMFKLNMLNMRGSR